MAKLVPIGTAKSDEKRERAIERMMERMRRGLDLGDRKFTRDEMHQR